MEKYRIIKKTNGLGNSWFHVQEQKLSSAGAFTYWYTYVQEFSDLEEATAHAKSMLIVKEEVIEL